MDLEQYKLLKARVEVDTFIDENNAGEKSLKFASLYTKYLGLFMQETRILKTMSSDKDKIYGELYHKFKFESDFKLDSAKEIDTYVRSNDRFYNKCLEFQNQEVVVKFLEETLRNILNTNYQIKNYIEIYKLRNGLLK